MAVRRFMEGESEGKRAVSSMISATNCGRNAAPVSLVGDRQILHHLRVQTDDSLPARVAKVRWFHSIEIAPGLFTPGVAPHEVFMAPADIYFRHIGGRSFLDIGCWDGFYSFEAERR